MPIRREKNWAQVKGQLDTIIREGVAAAATTLQVEMIDMLSKPGRGRLYARGQAGAKFTRIGRFDRIDLVEVAAERFGELLERRRARVEGRSRRNLTRRNQGFHRASRPGDPPAADTGRLRQSVQVDGSKIKNTTPAAKVGTNVQYGLGLEFGTARVAPRPWARPSSKKSRPKIISAFRTMLARLGRVT